MWDEVGRSPCSTPGSQQPKAQCPGSAGLTPLEPNTGRQEGGQEGKQLSDSIWWQLPQSVSSVGEPVAFGPVLVWIAHVRLRLRPASVPCPPQVPAF